MVVVVVETTTWMNSVELREGFEEEYTVVQRRLLPLRIPPPRVHPPKHKMNFIISLVKKNLKRIETQDRKRKKKNEYETSSRSLSPLSPPFPLPAVAAASASLFSTTWDGPL